MKKYFVRSYFSPDWQEVPEATFRAWVDCIKAGGPTGNTDGVELYLAHHTKVVEA